MAVTTLSDGAVVTGVSNNILQGDGINVNVDISNFTTIVVFQNARITSRACANANFVAHIEIRGGIVDTEAFYGATIQNLVIYDGSIDVGAFKNAKIESVTIMGGNFHASFIQSSIDTLSILGGTYSNTPTFASSDIKNLLIPEGAISVPENCLRDSNFPNIKSLSLPQSLREIGKNAFMNTNLDNLEQLIFPTKLIVIDDYAFQGVQMNNVESFVLPDNTSLGSSVFRFSSFRKVKYFSMGKNAKYGNHLFDGLLIGDLKNLMLRTETYLPIFDIVTGMITLDNNIEQIVSMLPPPALKALAKKILEMQAASTPQ